MLDQLLIAGLFFALVISLIMTSWSAVWVFAGAMLIAYFLGLVDTAEVLAKATNSGLITLILLLLVSIGLEKLSWLTRLSGKLITPGYYASLLRMGFFTALFSAFVNNTAVVAALAHTVRSNRHHPASKLLLPLSYAAILGVNRLMVYTNQFGDTGAHVDETFQELRQSLPAVEDVNTFLSSHQVAIAQLAIQYCDAAIGTNAAPNPDAEGVVWTNFLFDRPAATAFDPTNRIEFVRPLIRRAIGQPEVGTQLLSQPTYTSVYDEVAAAAPVIGGRPDNLIDRLLAGNSDTRAIAKGVCASVLGSAATLVQ